MVILLWRHIYTGLRALGNGSGTYTAAGNTIVTYVNGKECIRYVVSYISSDGIEMQGTVSDKSSSMEFKAKKKIYLLTKSVVAYPNIPPHS